MRLAFIFSGTLLMLLTVKGVAQTDSTLYTFDMFMEDVLANHPMYRQADLVPRQGEANLRRARGGFDPELKSTYDNKQFDGKDYYRFNVNEVKIPTVLGLELKAGYENSSGSFLNPEDVLPDNGLAYAGISLPIGKGLFFDERRQMLRQAEVFNTATDFERTLMINTLVFEASKVYWDWYYAWNTYAIMDESVGLAEFRYNAVRESFIQGDVPAIDTLEAFILVQNRQLSRNQALIDLRQASLTASNFLWTEDLEPLNFSEYAHPISYNVLPLDTPPEDTLISGIIDNVPANHPEILLMQASMEQLDIERRWKAEKLKPKLNINYNLLNQPVGRNPFEGYSTNDFKWGLEFGMPLFLRAERGDLQVTRIKISQTSLKLQQKQLEITNKIRAYQTELDNIYQQIELYKNAVNNYERLLAGERRKFEEGESSLFLVNSRENSLINAEVKLVELVAKYKKSQAGMVMAIGGGDITL
jgi:outer membrane protein TolC